MVDDNWYNCPDNKEFIGPNWVAISGKAWGDPMDPEDIEREEQRVQEAKAKARGVKKERVDEVNASRAKPKPKPKGKQKETQTVAQPIVSGSNVDPGPSGQGTSTIGEDDGDDDFYAKLL